MVNIDKIGSEKEDKKIVCWEAVQEWDKEDVI